MESEGNNVDNLEIAVGTPNYLAPQIVENSTIDYCVDNFSIGATLFYLLCGKVPFPGNTFQQVYDKSKEACFDFDHLNWKSVSKEAKDFITRLLEPEPTKRMSLK